MKILWNEEKKSTFTSDLMDTAIDDDDLADQQSIRSSRSGE